MCSETCFVLVCKLEGTGTDKFKFVRQALVLVPFNGLCCHRASRGLSVTSALSVIFSLCALLLHQHTKKVQKAWFKHTCTKVMSAWSGKGVWVQNRLNSYFQHFYPRQLCSSQPVSTAKQSESITRDSCSCCCYQCGQKQVLMLPRSFCAENP